MNSSLPCDYTPERARKVYGRNEYTKWAIQSHILDTHTPKFQVSITVIRTNRKIRQRRRHKQPLLCIFLFGYEDEPFHWLGKVAPLGQGPYFWCHVLLRIKDFYLKGEFYSG